MRRPDLAPDGASGGPAFDVSAVVPCRNEVRFIEACLRSVLAWKGSEEHLGEVLVVDGMSTDGTRELVSRIAESDPRVKLVDNPSTRKPQALNLGVSAAQGRWVMRLDAHARYPVDYLERCLETATRTGAENVGGVCETRVADDSLQAAIVQAVTTHMFGVGNSRFRVGGKEGPCDTVPFGFFRREVFDRLGLFDERLPQTQDQEFNERIQHGGGTVWLNPGIRAEYFNQARLADFLGKVLSDRGPWNPYRWYLAPYSFRWRHAAPLVFVLAIVLLLGGSFVWAPLRLVLGGLLGVYLVAASAAAVQQSIRYRRVALCWLLPPAFLAYHLCYGLGGLWGLVRLATGTAPVQRPATTGQTGTPGATHG